MSDWTSRVQIEFSRNPQEFVNFLLSRHFLKGNAREALTDYILAHQDVPGIGEMFWILLLPRRLSVVAVEGCCNLACRMCGGSRGKLSYLEVARLEKMLINTPTVELVTFVAGNSEPLMNPELAGNLRLTREHKANWDIVTNGHLLNDRMIDVMVSDPGASRLNISLDACRPATYQAIRRASLDRVLGNLRNFRDAKRSRGVKYPAMSLLMVGMEDNIEQLPEFVELAAELEAERVLLSHMLRDYMPGDFMRNVNWPQAIKDAQQVASRSGVRLELPADVVIAGQSLDRKGERRDGATGAGPKTNLAESSSKVEIPEDQKFLSCKGCPWLQDVHVQLNGVMNPCCNVGVDIGNIYDGPLFRNVKYLRSRIAHTRGLLYPECMKNLNCEYVAEIKRLKIIPPFIENTEMPAAVA
ncbi:MAG: hypothetical protein A2283_02125 [Lentisphaerae bacterium RIFOXYA12_FULL_48_11]|nr:MAG: hypothetical protein A2283_02125 [Lentisphaerae bacterium RIFOXYA12_FULL_48_11]